MRAQYELAAGSFKFVPSIGLRAVNGNLMFNVDMMLGGGEAGTSSIGGKVGVKYAF